MHNFRLEHFFIFVCACLTSSAIFQIVSALNIWTNSFVALSVSLCLSFSFTYISLSYSYILCPFYINRQVLSWLYHHFLNRTHHAFLHHTLTIPKPFYHKYSLKNRTKLFLQVSIHSHKSRSFPSLSFLHPFALSIPFIFLSLSIAEYLTHKFCQSLSLDILIHLSLFIPFSRFLPLYSLFIPLSLSLLLKHFFSSSLTQTFSFAYVYALTLSNKYSSNQFLLLYLSHSQALPLVKYLPSSLSLTLSREDILTSISKSLFCSLHKHSQSMRMSHCLPLTQSRQIKIHFVTVSSYFGSFPPYSVTRWPDCFSRFGHSQ